MESSKTLAKGEAFEPGSRSPVGDGVWVPIPEDVAYARAGNDVERSAALPNAEGHFKVLPTPPESTQTHQNSPVIVIGGRCLHGLHANQAANENFPPSTQLFP